MKENYQIYLPYQFHLTAHSLDREPKLSHKKMKTPFLSNMSKSRRLSSTFIPMITGDAGSQYRCGRVGRGIQPPSAPHTPHQLHTQTFTKSIQNARFSTFRLDHHDGRTNGPTEQRTNGRTNGPTDGRTKPLIELRVRN